MKIKIKKIFGGWGGGGGGRGDRLWGGGGGVRVDVNEELKFLGTLTKKIRGGGRVGGRGGSGWM